MRKPLNYLVMVMLLLTSIAGSAQKKQVSGKVTDSKDGAPIPGVTVRAKGAVMLRLLISMEISRFLLTAKRK